MDPTYPETCPTCGEPYRKGVITVCSNAFHCCRDCFWSEGRRLKLCPECAEAERRWKEQWLRRTKRTRRRGT